MNATRFLLRLQIFIDVRVRSLGDGLKTSIEIFIVFQKVLVHTK